MPTKRRKTEMEKLKIGLFDLDGSLAGYVEQLVADLELLRGPGDPVITAENIWSHDHAPYIKARMDLIKSLPGWWRKLPVIKMGKFVFDLARNLGFHNVVVTKAPQRHPNAWTEKVEWSLIELGKEDRGQRHQQQQGSHLRSLPLRRLDRVRPGLACAPPSRSGDHAGHAVQQRVHPIRRSCGGTAKTSMN